MSGFQILNLVRHHAWFCFLLVLDNSQIWGGGGNNTYVLFCHRKTIRILVHYLVGTHCSTFCTIYSYSVRHIHKFKHHIHMSLILIHIYNVWGVYARLKQMCQASLHIKYYATIEPGSLTFYIEHWIWQKFDRYRL